MALSPSALAFRRDYTKQHEPEMKAVCLYIYTPLLSQDLYLDTYIYTVVYSSALINLILTNIRLLL